MSLLEGLAVELQNGAVFGLLDLALRSYWALCTVAAFLALLPPWKGIDWFRNAVLVSACRGKLADGYPSNALGPLSDIFVPQKWFSHFYIVGCLSNALVLSIVRHAWTGNGQPAVVLLGAFQLHLIRRLVETVWMMRYPKEAKMHVMAYAFGMSYYVVVPLTYLVWCTRAREVCPTVRNIGLAIFVVGSVMQWHAHYLLSKLGEKTGSKRRGYVIPRGGLFELVSCPHYFGEVVIYLGLATMCGTPPSTDVAPWYPFVWVVVNLTLAARMTHRWYLSHFKTYDRLGRRALIPYVY